MIIKDLEYTIASQSITDDDDTIVGAGTINTITNYYTSNFHVTGNYISIQHLKLIGIGRTNNHTGQIHSSSIRHYFDVYKFPKST